MIDKNNACLITKLLTPKIWVESDIAGNQHVMMQYDDSPPFKYCSFFYDYAYTNNAMIISQSINLAISLGAKEPVERKHITFPNK